MRVRRNFERPEGKKSARLVVIAAEGKETENIYFEAMKRLRQASNVHVEILHRNDHSSSPIVVYDQIQQFKKEYNIDDSTHLVSPLHSLRAPLFSLRSGVSVL